MHDLKNAGALDLAMCNKRHGFLLGQKACTASWCLKTRDAMIAFSVSWPEAESLDGTARRIQLGEWGSMID